MAIKSIPADQQKTVIDSVNNLLSMLRGLEPFAAPARMAKSSFGR